MHYNINYEQVRYFHDTLFYVCYWKAILQDRNDNHHHNPSFNYNIDTIQLSCRVDSSIKQ